LHLYKEKIMSKYLLKINYNGATAAGLRKEGGTSRVNQATKTIESLGGTLESLYFAFGETDAYLICDLPSHAHASNASLLLKSVGMDSEVTVLITPEEVDEAAKLDPDYRAAGQ
jgi:uncharacterized protein with GYD domain